MSCAEAVWIKLHRFFKLGDSFDRLITLLKLLRFLQQRPRVLGAQRGDDLELRGLRAVRRRAQWHWY